MDCIITYQKSNGEIFCRGLKHSYISKQIGDETSMGWKIVDIHYRHNNNFYCYADYMRIIRKRDTFKNKIEKKIARYLMKKLRNISN